MEKAYKELFRQAQYDFDTAIAMYDAGRYFYAVFMCHLSIEKALKALYARKLEELPPRTHNLAYLAAKMSLQLPDDMQKFINLLNLESVATRYPEDIEKSLQDYTRERGSQVVEKSREVLEWLKTR